MNFRDAFDCFLSLQAEACVHEYMDCGVLRQVNAACIRNLAPAEIPPLRKKVGWENTSYLVPVYLGGIKAMTIENFKALEGNGGYIQDDHVLECWLIEGFTLPLKFSLFDKFGYAEKNPKRLAAAKALLREIAKAAEFTVDKIDEENVILQFLRPADLKVAGPLFDRIHAFQSVNDIGDLSRRTLEQETLRGGFLIL